VGDGEWERNGVVWQVGGISAVGRRERQSVEWEGAAQWEGSEMSAPELRASTTS
jgi:hypothetical protein